MSWESRGNRQYLYRSFRDESGKVKRQYIGGGSTGVLAAVQMKEQAEQRVKDREIAAGLQAKHAELSMSVKNIEDVLRLLMESQLLAAGFHQHGVEWRLRRVK